jgi:hypothetical protein
MMLGDMAFNIMTKDRMTHHRMMLCIEMLGIMTFNIMTIFRMTLD